MNPLLFKWAASLSKESNYYSPLSEALYVIHFWFFFQNEGAGMTKVFRRILNWLLAMR